MLLAKSEPPLSLLDHTLDVAGMASLYAKLWPHLEERCEYLFEDAVLATLLHDLGKAASGFQALLRGEDDDTWGGYRHEILSSALAATMPATIRRQELLLAVMTHHRSMNDPSTDAYSLLRYDPARDRVTPFTERLAQLEEHWLELRVLVGELGLDLALPERPCDLPNPFKELGDGAAGLRSVYLRGLLVGSDHLASAGISELPVLQEVTPESFTFEINMHQREAANTEGSLFVSAPTGSGKTELAELWQQNNQSEVQGRRVFYILPYTASINAMYHRLGGDFGEDAVSLLHGRSAYFTYRWFAEGGLDGKTSARKASALRRQTKELYHPVKVLTPHQILLSFLGHRGWERSFCEYTGALFIVDEIHAYEPRLFGLFCEMLRRLTGELGAKVCVMSATFPRLLQEELSQYVGDVAHIEVADRDRYSRHVVNLEDGSVADRLPEIREHLAHGERVLVVLNTVTAAIECYEHLRDAASNPALIHARLIQRDRQAAEARLAAGDVDLLVGTQAIEVSLDIDFDRLYSDPAPLDALLQRFGRVNRKTLHELESKPEEKRYKDVIVCRDRWPGSFSIYDKRLVRRTLDVLREGVLRESEVGSMIDEVYDEKQLRNFLLVAHHKRDALRQFVDTLAPGKDTPRREDDLLDELIDSIAIVPALYREEHQALLGDGRYFDAQDFVMNISLRRYHTLKRQGKLLEEVVEEQKQLYGLFPYEAGLGPDL